ncbi:MAG TPA: fused MFS/spermidine synthase [Caulobacteraceae bacterium]|jgi:spermidine synthase|nr:fused MFS/spermidine synthase [Caulobacteraceae bacterium]
MTSVAYLEHPAKARPALAPWLFVAVVFASAALVFLVEPLVGKLLLPLLGGSPAVWNTSLAFFQLALLAGYGYAHALQRLGSLRRQMAVHLAMLTLAAMVLPLRMSGLMGPPWVQAPALWLAATLAVSLGPPFAVLSATAPLLQTWYARLNGNGNEAANPYSLYAASNLGSLLALAAYPMLVEPLVGLSAQARLWSFAYAGFALLLAGMTTMAWRLPAVAAPVLARVAATGWRERTVWIALAAAPSSLLAGVTAHLAADVASAPFLWVVPLELYLATFVIAFAGRAKGPSPGLLMVQVLAVPTSLSLLFEPTTPWPQQLAVHLTAFFVTALVCHQGLAARRPEPGRLTEFYLCLSVGGVIGGGFNAFLAPLLFPDVWEYPAVLVLACLARPSAPAKPDRRGLGWLAAGLVWVAPLCIPALALPDILRQALMLAPVVIAVMLRDRTVAVVALFAALALAGEVQGIGRYREHHRSFFGVIHIAEVHPKGLGTARIMVHGTTLHGVQAQGRGQACLPTAYYASPTVIGSVFARERARGPLRMGVVGLGAGTVATFVRPGDSMRFFEIDPLVERLTLDPKHFSFVHGCARGPVDVVLGDARLSLAREPAASYDLLLIDAFSSDSVPTHLLTVEALHGYLRLLRPHGVLLLHLSNRNLELVGPAAAAAKAAGASFLKGVHWVEEGTSPYVESSGIVLLVAPDPHSLDRYRADHQWTEHVRLARPWTDDYTNVWGAMIARFRGEG